MSGVDKGVINLPHVEFSCALKVQVLPYLRQPLRSAQRMLCINRFSFVAIISGCQNKSNPLIDSLSIVLIFNPIPSLRLPHYPLQAPIDLDIIIMKQPRIVIIDYPMDEYMLEHEKGNGTFSVVFMAVSIKTGERVAIKCMKKKFQSLENVTKLKEIQALKILSSHKHIIKLLQVLFDQPTGKLALVFELMEMNLYEALKNRKNPMSMKKIKFYMYQVLMAINHMHQKGIFHRDIKPENILVRDDHVKLADLGSCKGKFSPYPYTQYISTRWYRAPECLMTDGYYNQKMDIWGFGCVLFELITKCPLFAGKDELDQVHKIHNTLGTPKPQVLERFKSHATHMEFNFPPKKGTGLDRLLGSNVTPDTRDLLHKLLAYDPLQRISAQDALKHEFFAEFYSNPYNNFRNSRGGGFGKGWNKTSGESDQQEYKNHGHSLASKDNKKAKQTKRPGGGSKVNLERAEDEGVLPRLPNPTQKTDVYKKSFYGKKASHELNFTALLQGKRMG